MLNKKDKITEKDVGFIDDSFFAMKNAVGYEEHCFNDFVSTKSKEDFEKYSNARKIRTELQLSIIKYIDVELKGQQWCKLKHICSQAMSTQELIARYSSIGDFELAKKLIENNKILFIEYLTLLGVNENNISNKTEA